LAGLSNQSITPAARGAIEELQRFAMQPGVMAALRRAQSEAAARLRADTALRSTFISLDPAGLDFGSGVDVPASAATIRVAVSRAGVDTAVERHPNSTQVLLVLDGPVETHVQTDAGWRIDRYGEGAAQSLENLWHLVPPGVWHKSNAPGPGDCTVVAFHSAREVRDDYR
jgi:hypothetical protein